VRLVGFCAAPVDVADEQVGAAQVAALTDLPQQLREGTPGSSARRLLTKPKAGGVCPACTEPTAARRELIPPRRESREQESPARRAA